MENVVDEEEAKAEEIESMIREHVLWEEKLQKQRAMIYEKKMVSKKIKNSNPSTRYRACACD